MSRAGYKLTNVASVGVNGLMLDAVVEGATQYMSLYDYLIGPVLLQGRVELAQLPFTRAEPFFAVLRPWSISFYKSAGDFTQRPYKIIPTCMLDTLPQLRQASVSSMSVTSGSAPEAGMSASNTGAVEEPEESKEEDTAPTASTNNSSRDAPVTEQRTNSASSSSASAPGLSRRGSFLGSLMSGDGRPRIELCTVDCSTFVLFPPEPQLQIWFDEVCAACARVETVKLRRSGAEQLATRRRLDLLPRSTLVVVRVKELILSSSTVALGRLTEFDDLGEGSAAGLGATISARQALSTITEVHSVGSDEEPSVASESLDGDVDESEFDAFFEGILEEYNASHSGASGVVPDVNLTVSSIRADADLGSHGSARIAALADSTSQQEPGSSNRRLADDSADFHDCDDGDDCSESLMMRSHDSSGFVSVARRVPADEELTGDAVTTQVLSESIASAGSSDHERGDGNAARATDVQASPLLSSFRSSSSSAARTAPGMLTRARHSFGRLMDPLVNSIVTAVRIQITPLTYSGKIC